MIDYHQNYQMLNARRSRGRILPPTPNKPSILQIPDTILNYTDLNTSQVNDENIEIISLS